MAIQKRKKAWSVGINRTQVQSMRSVVDLSTNP